MNKPRRIFIFLIATYLISLGIILISKGINNNFLTEIVVPLIGGVIAIGVEKDFKTKNLLVDRLCILFIMFLGFSIILSFIGYNLLLNIFLNILMFIGILRINDSRIFGDIVKKKRTLIKYIVNFILLIFLVDVLTNIFLNQNLDIIDNLVNFIIEFFSSGLLIFSISKLIVEEYGWRYFLQDNLKDKLGKRASVIVTSILWGLLTTIIAINSKEFSGIVFLENFVYTFCLGLFLGLAYLKTYSILVTSIIRFLGMILALTLIREYPNEASQVTNIVVKSISYLIVFIPIIISKEFKHEKPSKIYVMKEINKE